MGFAKLYGSFGYSKKLFIEFQSCIVAKWPHEKSHRPVDVNRRCKSAAKKVG